MGTRGPQKNRCKKTTNNVTLALRLIVGTACVFLSTPAQADVQPLQQPYFDGPPYQPRAEQGNEWDQLNLANAYKELEQYKEAADWYRRAAEQGNVGAQYELADLYEHGLGVAQDYATAVKWYREAAKQSYEQAQFALAKAYLQGHGVVQNFVEGEKWLHEVAEMDDREAMPILAGLYAHGAPGITQDYAKAYFWSLVASQHGNSSLTAALADEKAHLTKQQIDDIEGRAEQWKPVPRNSSAGLMASEGRIAQFWQLHAEKGDPEAENVLGAMYRDGRGVMKGYYQAAEWFSRSADQGYVWGEINLGELYENGWGVTPDTNKAINWYKRALQHGINNGDSAGNGDSINAAYALGRLYARGNSSKDYEEAYYWFLVSSAHQQQDDIKRHLTATELEEARNRLATAGIQAASARPQAQPYGDPYFVYFKPCEQLQFTTPSEVITDLHIRDVSGPWDGNSTTCYTPEREPHFDEQLQRANAGNVSAQLYVGWLYYLGKGVRLDYAEALKWIRMAADEGLPDAQISLGHLYLNGAGVPRDFKTAYFWMRVAELQSGVRGRLEPPSFQVAKHLTTSQIQTLDTSVQQWKPKVDRAAAENGNDSIQYWLGLLYSRGWGIKQSDAEAALWWKRAAEQGNRYAQNDLALSYSWGAGVKENADEAVFWWLLSANQTDTQPFKYLKGDRAEAIRKRVVTWKPHPQVH